MPQRINKVSDIGNSMIFSSVYDIDNIYLSEEGWVYRHYKKADKSEWWDEIIVAGEVDITDGDNAPVLETNPDPLGVAPPADVDFEGGVGISDSKSDFEYSDLKGVDTSISNVPFPPTDSAGGGPPASDDDSSSSPDSPADDSDDGSASAPMG